MTRPNDATNRVENGSTENHACYDLATTKIVIKTEKRKLGVARRVRVPATVLAHGEVPRLGMLCPRTCGRGSNAPPAKKGVQGNGSLTSCGPPRAWSARAGRLLTPWEGNSHGNNSSPPKAGWRRAVGVRRPGMRNASLPREPCPPVVSAPKERTPGRRQHHLHAP